MKNFTKVFRLLFPVVIAAMFSLTACEGPEGPQGPAGPQGPQGIQGAEGPAGQNADVKSYTFTVSSSDFSSNAATLNVPAITTSIFNTGVVLTYWRASSGWRLTPFTFIDNNDVSRSIISMYSVGRVTILAESSSDTVDPTTIYTGSYRVVVIPGTAGKKADDINYENYNEVARMYGLPLDLPAAEHDANDVPRR